MIETQGKLINTLVEVRRQTMIEFPVNGNNFANQTNSPPSHHARNDKRGEIQNISCYVYDDLVHPLAIF